ncbi:MAG TPA: hypothetical protein VLS93_04675 [Anaeromyxobacteraceae bacterium]|nr:hypothetical protein [Anaeromyxobacteraceae bacterium]
MAKYAGGTRVKSGYYWHTHSWRVEVVPPEGGLLPGEGTASYHKVPFPVLFVVVPVMGLLFLVFLPFLGFGLFAYAIAKRLGGLVGRGATELVSTVHPGMVPGESYLTGKAGEEKKGAPPAAPEAIEKLEKEVAGRREK